ncbi:MAG: 4-(cytidine 5'-diphospho)-2-C-methyl-D-erythritol kinase [Chitinispirillales bacterium]|jgi:4-diphosphocytidyl-2-C-methyl-D-erythritol kinase|nr:4-(cytidine 5'-diphospho)-2-C-methyl-D-erythritol kinase [Chitinispirillales bacterium]
MITIESPTRITFALDIIRRLDDGPFCGYHELGIVKHQIALADTVSVEAFGGDSDIVECNDPRVPVDGSNICVKVCELLRERFGRGGYVRIFIDKKIPVMGGMAGGSANAAAALRAIDRLWELGLTIEQFKNLGRELGMDVPYFFTGGTAFDSEATGVIESIGATLKFHIVLAIPDFGISTKEAYGGIDYERIGKNVSLTNEMIGAFGSDDFDMAAKNLHNDFESSIFPRHPRLKEIRDDLLKAGCISACMTGSGSTIIGIASTKSAAQKIASSIDCRTIVTETF